MAYCLGLINMNENDPAMKKNVLIYTVHKAASMFLNRIAHDTADEMDMNCFSINADQYYSKIRKQSWKRFIMEQKGPACFGPIRSGEDTSDTPAIFPENLDDYAVVLHLRDPRDMLVSLYYSQTYSHPKRQDGFNPDDFERKVWEKEGVDAFVLKRAPQFKELYRNLTSRLLGKDNVVFLTYETLVTNYSSWLSGFLSAFQNGSDIMQIHTCLLKKYEHAFEPMAEDIYRHKRQITPGDYLRKLKRDTIDALNRELKPVLAELNYV